MSAASSATNTAKPAAAAGNSIGAQLHKLQHDVSYLNGIGMDLYELGKLKTSALHFHHALQQMKAISKLKKSMKGEVDEEVNPKDCSASSSLVKKACQPLLIDTVSSATSLHWETVASLALMHNAALVHLKGKKLTQAKQMLDLALNLLKKEMQQSDLHKLLDASKYAVSVVISLYITLGRVMSQMPNSDNAQVKQVFKIASNLMERFVDQKRKALKNANGDAALKKRRTSTPSISSGTPPPNMKQRLPPMPAFMQGGMPNMYGGMPPQFHPMMMSQGPYAYPTAPSQSDGRFGSGGMM